MIQYSDLIAAFPEFSNSTTYPQTQVDFWLPQAYNQLNACRFDAATLDLAAMLFVAHNITLSAQAAQAANSGAIVGKTVAPQSSKSVGGVSVSYDVGAVTVEGAGPYNATSYGQRLYKLMQAYSAGPLYVPATNDNPANIIGGTIFGWPGY